ncbi:MAG: hypothetical protein K0R49_600 [Burkholderiales bacterium]|jgi:hypothetical protein|nr:hypothetical protein [Burkholderiales bacterium]
MNLYKPNFYLLSIFFVLFLCLSSVFGDEHWKCAAIEIPQIFKSDFQCHKMEVSFSYSTEYKTAQTSLSGTKKITGVLNVNAREDQLISITDKITDSTTELSYTIVRSKMTNQWEISLTKRVNRGSDFTTESIPMYCAKDMTGLDIEANPGTPLIPKKNKCCCAIS